MPLATRMALASLDDVRSSIHTNAPDAFTIVASWSRNYETLAVMGLLDEDGQELPVSADYLARLTSVVTRPMPAGALRLAYPDAELGGSLLLRMPVDEPEWARVGDHVAEMVSAGMYVSDDDIRDAIWLMLEACSLPTGAVRVKRVAMVADHPDQPLFEPVELLEYASGVGKILAWGIGLPAFPTELIPATIVRLLSELVGREERQLSQRNGKPMVFTESLVRL